ncbi:MAG: Ig-like domain-containing domain [Planctomycetota bacterium]|jgi:hypothetical protein
MRLLVLSVAILGLVIAGCTGGAAGDPKDDIGDIIVLTHSPGNGDQLDEDDSLDGFNALNNPTLTNPGAVTLVFTNSLDSTSVINPDPSDPQGTRNVRLFYFDTSQGAFDPNQDFDPGVNPPGANVLVEAQTTLTTTNRLNDTLIIRPEGVTANAPLAPGQYSVIVEVGVRGADGDAMAGDEYFFFFRVGQDALGPVVVSSSPFPNEENVHPTSDLVISMSETIQAATVNSSTIRVSFQPAGTAQPTPIPGNFYTDGGNGPGNNFPNLQLDHNGNPGLSGTSPRNGADIVFRPDLFAFPVNMTAEDPWDTTCTQRTDPPRKGNQGFPLGQAITVEFVTTGVGVTDTAGNPVKAGSPNTVFTFQTTPLPDPVFAPNTRGAVYYGDTIGVGVIDVDPSRTPYLVGPNPVRPQNSVVTSGVAPAQRIVRVAVPDLVDLTTDTRPYTSFYTFVCDPAAPVNIAMGNVYAASASVGGGEVVVIDAFNMVPLGRFGTPSPGGIALTAIGAGPNTGRLSVSNFSANTVTVFDIGDVMWFTGGSLWISQGGLQTAVQSGQSQLILDEDDFERIFPAQRFDSAFSPPGPPIIGTINVGISPTKCKITGLPSSLGSPGFPCFSPFLVSNTIVCSLNAGENTADFSELTNLTQSSAIEPDLDGVNLSSQGSDVAWSPPSFGTGSYYFFIAGIGGTVEIFASGFVANSPSVRPEASTNLAPNKIINSIGGLVQPSSVQWITNGNAVSNNNGYSFAVLVAETGENRIQQLAVTAENPSNLFNVINANHASGLGPVDITGDPVSAWHFTPCGPRFTTYYVANAGEGTVSTASYQGGVIGSTIGVPGVQLIASWWSR